MHGTHLLPPRPFAPPGPSPRLSPPGPPPLPLPQAYADYSDMMALTEDLVRACALAVKGSTQVGYEGEGKGGEGGEGWGGVERVVGGYGSGDRGTCLCSAGT